MKSKKSIPFQILAQSDWLTLLKKFETWAIHVLNLEVIFGRRVAKHLIFFSVQMMLLHKDNIIRFTDNVCPLLINKIKKFGEFLNFPTFLF